MIQRHFVRASLSSFVLACAALAAPLEAQSLRRVAAPSAAPAVASRAYVSAGNASSVAIVDLGSNAVVGSIPVGGAPGRLAVSADGARVYVPCAANDTLAVIATATNSVIATIPVLDAPAVAAIAPGGARVWVGGANGAVSVVDTASASVVGSLGLGAPSTGAVDHIVFSPDGSLAYANWGSVHVIDTATLALVDSIYAGNNVTTIALSPDGTRLYAAAAFGYGAFSFYGTLQVVDTASRSVTSSILVWGYPLSLAITPDGTRAYLGQPYQWADTGYGAAYIGSPWVASVNLVTNTLGGSFNAGGQPRYLAISSDGARVLVSVPTANTVKVASTATNTITSTIPVAGAPTGIALTP